MAERFYRVKEGKYSESVVRDGQKQLISYSKGEVVRSDRDLTKVFEGKFEKVHPDEITPDAVKRARKMRDEQEKKRKAQEAEAEVEETDTEDTEEASEEVAPEKQWGKNVTKNFQLATKYDYKVYNNGENFIVVKEDINLAKELPTKGDVVTFIKSHLKEQRKNKED